MYKNFREEDLTQAYKMLSESKIALVCTKGIAQDQYNITPIGWFTPFDYEPVTKALFVSDPDHQCAKNAEREKEFAICVPLSEKEDTEIKSIIEKCGSLSSEKADKFKQFNIQGEKASKTNLKLIPAHSKGMIEFKLIRIIEEGSVKIFLGEAVSAWKRV